MREQMCACGHEHEMEVGCSVCSCELWTSPRQPMRDAEIVRDALTVHVDNLQATRTTNALAALDRLVAAAERTEAETKRADWLYQDCEEKLSQIKAAEAERDAALAALTFYADERNWQETRHHAAPIWEDGGDVARAAFR